MKLIIKKHDGNGSKIYREVLDKKGKVIIKELLYYESDDIIIRQAIPESRKDIRNMHKIMKYNNYIIKKKLLKEIIETSPLENFVYVVTDQKGVVLAVGQMVYSFRENITRTRLYKSKKATKKQISEIKMKLQEIKFCDKLIFLKK